MRRITVGTLCFLLVSTVGLAGDPDYAVRENGGPMFENQPDKASVYVVRPANMGKAIRIWAFADESVIGLTKGNTYTHVYLDPGTYIFWSRAENVSAIEYEVAAGQTYFIKHKVKMGGLKARVRTEFLSEEEGLAALKKCEKYSTLTDAGKARGAEISAEKYAVAKEKASEN